MFLFTPLLEGRLVLQFPHDVIVRRFYSRPYSRGDKHIHEDVPYSVEFLFTPLLEGRLTVHNLILSADMFLFTPLLEGRPLKEMEDRKNGEIVSIHAPTRGATHGFLPLYIAV